MSHHRPAACPLWLKGGGPGGSIPEPHQGEGVLWAEGGGAPPPGPGLPKIVQAASSRRPETVATSNLSPPAWGFPRARWKARVGLESGRAARDAAHPRSTSWALWGHQAACLHPTHQKDPGPQALPPGLSSFPGTPETLAEKGHRRQHRALASPAARPLSRPRPADFCLTQWNIRAGKYLF